MPNDIRITVLQEDLVWEDPEANREKFGQLISVLAGKTDLVIMPEMFPTGFTLQAAHLAETMEGATVSWLKDMARTADCAVTGSVIIREKSNFYNRLLWAAPSGEILSYDKKHLFRYAKEDEVYTAGQAHLVVDLKGWKVRPFVCYDLRFPVWSANRGREYDLAVYVANWPETRAYHWRSLLTARAIENQAYVAGVNRVGVDGNNIAYNGESVIVDPEGNVLHQCGGKGETVTVRLDRQALEDYRNRFPAWKDMDS